VDGDASAPALWAAHTPASNKKAANKPNADGGDGHLCRLLAAAQRYPHHARLLREGRDDKQMHFAVVFIGKCSEVQLLK